MKLALEMAVMDMDGEITAVAVGEDSAKFHGMLRLNDTAAEIIKLLSKEITADKMKKTLCEKYDESTPEEISGFVDDFLSQLRAEGLLTE